MQPGDAGEPDSGQPEPDAGEPDSGTPGEHDAGLGDAGVSDAGEVVPGPPDSGTPDAEARPDAGVVCTTRITYGTSWLKPAGHTTDFDDAPGLVTWDGTFTVDGNGNSVATLSNGWKPTFTGRAGAVISLDSSCDPGVCRSRIGYGTNWLAPANHPARFDDVDGVLASDGFCRNTGAQSYVTLTPGWQPHFTGTNACEYSLRYQQCGALFANSVLDVSCPDPGVMRDVDGGYVMVCTSGGPGYPIRTSPDLVRWTSRGTVFTAATKPAWATGDFWAPEMHRVGNNRYVLYFSARHTDNSLAIGAATATTPLGPWTAKATPLVKEAYPGVIDVHQFTGPDGRLWLLWKRDGNAVNGPTPIRIQQLAADGVTKMGAVTDLIDHDQTWEGKLVEAPWMIFEGGFYYLFYSANNYGNATYAIGVARSTSPTGPFTKSPDNPVLFSKGDWAGPGHGSVVRALAAAGCTSFTRGSPAASAAAPAAWCWSSPSPSPTAGPR
ncbi:MAG: family 43 glycosylhydrolase [Archangiaceae bacterium]|nr:family 43 glycosylhydrolase [Archangiaceae bacterium]